MNNKKLNDELSTLPNTTAGRRIRRLATMRYSHVSKGITPILYELAQRFPTEAAGILREQPGETYNMGRNSVKRFFDAMYPGKLRKFARAMARHDLSYGERSYA